MNNRKQVDMNRLFDRNRNWRGFRTIARLLTLLVILVTGVVMVNAQQLSLPDAVNMALRNSLNLQLLKNNAEIASTNNYIGVAGGLPVVTANASDIEQVTSVHQKLNTGTEITRAAAAGNNLSANLTVGMLLYNGSRVMATKSRLAQLAAQSEKLLNAQVQNIMADVMTAYYEVLRQQAFVRTIDQSIAVAQKRLEIVKTQQSVGMANNADLFQSQLDLNALEQSKQAQLLTISQAKTDLLLLLNLKPDSAIVIADTILVDPSISLSAILGDISRNADVMAAQDQIRISEWAVKETHALRSPTVRANAGYNLTRNQIAAGNVLLNKISGPQAGLTLAIPIYNGTIFKRQQKVAEINVKNAELQRDILIRDYTAAAVRTFQSYESTLRQLKAQQESVELSRKLLDLALLRYELRQATILEVRQAQQSFETASYTMTNLRFTAKAAEIELRRVVNQLAL